MALSWYMVSPTIGHRDQKKGTLMTTASIDPTQSETDDPRSEASTSEANSVLSNAESLAKKLPTRRPKSLSGSQRRAPLAQGHHLKPIVQMAKTQRRVIEATKIALEQHELIKVSINGESPTERKSGQRSPQKRPGHMLHRPGRHYPHREREKRAEGPIKERTMIKGGERHQRRA